MAKRDDIVDAALTIVCDEGIRALTLPLLFKKAHTGAGTFYHYFDGREGLIDAVFDKCCADANLALAGIVEGDYDAHDAFVRLCSKLILSHIDYPRELTFLYLYAYGYAEPDERRCRVIPSLTLLTAVISKAREQGLVSCEVDPAMSARIVRGMVASVYWSYQRDMCKLDQALADELAERAWRAMLC